MLECVVTRQILLTKYYPSNLKTVHFKKYSYLEIHFFYFGAKKITFFKNLSKKKKKLTLILLHYSPILLNFKIFYSFTKSF